MKIIKIDNFYFFIQINSNTIILNNKTSEYFTITTLKDIPKNIKQEIRPVDLNNALTKLTKGENQHKYLSLLDDNLINKLKNLKHKIKANIYTPHKNHIQLMSYKHELENYYDIVVNADNTNEKYYYDNTQGRYVLFNHFDLGVLIERDSHPIYDETQNKDIPLCLPDNDLKTIFGMFRRKQKPQNDLICFSNCVFDTRTFTKTTGNSFTTKNIHYNYIALCDCEKDTLVERVLKMIFIPKNNPNNNHAFMDFLQRLGACFLRQNKHKFIYMLTGSGDDGKSIILYILSLLFGEQGLWMKIESFTDKFFKVNMNNTCVLLTDELNSSSFTKEVTATLKDITGRSSTDSRVMYSQTTVKVQDYGIPFMATNIIPHVPFNDSAYWKRLHIVRLPNKFVAKNEKDLIDNEYIKDENLEEKLAADTAGVEWLISASINAYHECEGNFTVNQSALDTQFIYDGKNPIRVFIKRFVRTGNRMDTLSVLEIKYHLLKFCIKNNITADELGVDSSQELSKEIGYKLMNKINNMEKIKKNGYVFYKGLCLNLVFRFLSL